VTRVVQAGIVDLELIIPMFDAYRQFYKRDCDLDGARAYLQARLERSEATVFLARDENSGAVLGFALCYSVGSALIAACASFARLEGALVLRLRTATNNETAQRVYDKAGFKRDAVYYTYDLSL
jgi:GNAT superfamily N-acetyltransferase